MNKFHFEVQLRTKQKMRWKWLCC